MTIHRWFDRHLHLRDGEMLKTILPCTLNQGTIGATVMGNLNHPDETSTIAKTLAYRNRILAALPPESDFIPCMTLYLTDEISPEEVVRGFLEGVWRTVKLYMANQNGKGGTTGSHRGVRNLLGRYRVFEAMEKYQIPLLGHFEAVEDDVDEFDREIVSTERHVSPMCKSFPGLPIVFEHLTDGRAADFVAGIIHPIYATVTAHHPIINRNAMFQGGMNPGNYCKPVPKRESHRQRVRKYVTSGNRRFGAGTDSAAHDESAKSHCYGCAAGIFTAPKALEMYATAFDEDNALEHLDPFLSENFLHVYGMQPSSETITIERRKQTIPRKVGGVQVFMGGSELPWTLVS